MRSLQAVMQRLATIPFCLVALSPACFAQNSIQLFAPVDVRFSATGTGTGSAAVNFNTTNLNLTCAASPITAVLSSTADSTGNLLVDNNINVTVIASGASQGPTNVCAGGVGTNQQGPFQNCFTTGYETIASQGQFTGKNPDTIRRHGRGCSHRHQRAAGAGERAG